MSLGDFGNRGPPDNGPWLQYTTVFGNSGPFPDPALSDKAPFLPNDIKRGTALSITFGSMLSTTYRSMPPRRSPESSSMVFLQHKGRKVAVIRPKTHQEAVLIATRYFKSLRHTALNCIVLSAQLPQYSAQGVVEIHPDSWQLVSKGVEVFEVDVADDTDEPTDASHSLSSSKPWSACESHACPAGWQPRSRTLKRISELERSHKLGPDFHGAPHLRQRLDKPVTSMPPTRRSTSLSDTDSCDTVVATRGVSKDKKATLECQAQPLSEPALPAGQRTLASYGIQKEATIWLVLKLRGGKPVIYLYPPAPIDASVKLSLVPHWKFSALYPMPEKQAAQGGKHCQSVKWSVVCDPNGVMAVKGTSTKVAYLFWEAETDQAMTNSNPQNSPGLTRSLVSSKMQEFYPRNGFIPGVTKCSPQDSVVLSAHDVAPYLDRSLTSLGLHVEARTSFITYWLPSILKHEFVAIRFLPQVDYEASAPLEINPLPDVVTRVFMLFQGIPPDRLFEWQGAQERSSKDVGFWVAVVGVDSARQRDKTLFRVLEWGGMEVF